jgi:CheY-like chemotaxis protein
MLRYAQKDVRVVILDYQMPRLTGADTLQYLRKLAPQVKIMALSGVPPELLPEDYRLGVDRFMTKPFRNTEFVSAITNLAGVPLPQAV